MSSAAAVIHGPGGGHGMHFANRADMRETREVYHHDKPQYNFMGIPFRKPKKVIELHTAGRTPGAVVKDSTFQALVRDHMARTGKRPTFIRYPGEGPAEFKGLTVEGLGYFGLRLLPGGSISEPQIG